MKFTPRFFWLAVVTLFIAATVGIFVVFGVINAYRKRKMKQVAAALGLELQPEIKLTDELVTYRSFPRLTQFSNYRNCFSGDAEGIAFKVFDFRDTNYSDRHETMILVTIHLIRKHRWTVECCGRQILIFSANRKVDYDQLKPLLSESLNMVMEMRTAGDTGYASSMSSVGAGT